MAISRAEREQTQLAPIRDAITAARLDIHTALPGVIQSFDPQRMTCTVQPAIRAAIIQKNGAARAVDLPLLVDCPVVFPGGGGYELTFPVKAGDDALIVFAERCIDAWWQSGGVQAAAEFRLHDLSDGFVIPGVRSQPRVLSGGVHMGGAEVRTDSGSARIQLNGDAVKIIAPAGVVVDTPTVTLTGDMICGGFSYLGHTHTGVHGETTPPH